MAIPSTLRTVTVHSFPLMHSKFILYKAAAAMKRESFRLTLTTDILLI